MASQTAGVFDINGGQKCFFFPVDSKGNLLRGADDMFLGKATEPFHLPNLAQHIQGKKYDRAFVLCHGWNNDPEATRKLYTGLISGLNEARNSSSNDLYIGINWPSIVLAETWEQYVERVTASSPGKIPGGAGKDGEVTFQELEEAQQKATLEELSKGLNIPAKKLEEYRQDTVGLKLAVFNQREALADHDKDIENGESRALADSPPPDIETADEYKDQLDKAFIYSAAMDPLSRGAGFGFLEILRGPTGRMMKKRAGIIGSQSHLIRGLLAELLASDLPVNLLGHSYGCKLLLDSIRSLFDPDLGAARVKDKKFNSFILCQPAISRWVFSPDGSGMYRPLLEDFRFNRPVVTLYSDNDAALRYLYPLGYFYSPREQESPVRGEPEKTGKEIKMRALLSANIPAAALGCHGPVQKDDMEYIHVLPVRPSGESYGFADMSQRCVGVKGNWKHSLQEKHHDEELGWGQKCVFWLWHELADG